MADSPETKVLKDINRHLGSIDQKSGGDGAVEGTADKTKALRAMQEMLGNFESLMEAKLKKLTLSTDRSFSQAFGNLKGFNEMQTNAMITELDTVIDKLEMNNRFLKASDDLEFLKEQERNEDLKVNKETNELLEDILEKEPGEGGAGGSGSGFGGLASLGLAGLGLSNLGKLFTAGGLLKLGKGAAIGLLGGVLFKSFLEGFGQGMENDKKSFGARLVSGLGKVFEDFSMGIFTQKDIEGMGDKIRSDIKKGTKDIQKAWNEYWKGGKTFTDAVSESLSGLTLGSISPENFKTIGKELEFFTSELGETIWTAILTAAGYDVEDVTKSGPARKKELAKLKKIREDRLRAFKDAQAIVPELESLFGAANVPEKEKERLRGLLSGKLATFSKGEIRGLGQESFMNPEKAQKMADERIKQRETFIANEMALLQRRIDKDRFDIDNAKRKADADIQAKLDAIQSEKMRQIEIADAVAKEKALLEATKKFQANEGEPPPTVIQQQTNKSYTEPNLNTQTDDLNLHRSDSLR